MKIFNFMEHTVFHIKNTAENIIRARNERDMDLNSIGLLNLERM